MRTKAWFLFVVLLSGAEVCAQDPREFLPLRVGNYWEYQYDEFYVYFKEFVRAVGETVMPNGKRYVVLHHRLSTGSSGGYNEYWRVDDSANTYFYEALDTTEVLFDRLGAKVGEWWMSWKYVPGRHADSSYMFGMVIDTGHVGTRATKFIAYNWGAPGPPGSSISWSNDYFTEGIGLTYREYEAYSKQELVGAIIDGDTLGVVSFVERGAEIGSPAALKLFQNFPNPFNSDTHIRLQLGQPGIVKLVVYDLLGREVRQLVDEERQSGEYVTVWDGKDDRGQSVSSGIYLYRLTAKDFNFTRKAVLLK
jgi:hypothetical protein